MTRLGGHLPRCVQRGSGGMGGFPPGQSRHEHGHGDVRIRGQPIGTLRGLRRRGECHGRRPRRRGLMPPGRRRLDHGQGRELQRRRPTRDCTQHRAAQHRAARHRAARQPAARRRRGRQHARPRRRQPSRRRLKGHPGEGGRGHRMKSRLRREAHGRITHLRRGHVSGRRRHLAPTGQRWHPG